MSARTCFLVALAAAATLAACGNLSNDDLRFLSALPKADEVELRVATSGGTGMMAGSALIAAPDTQALVGQPAEFYGSAADVAAVVNGGVRRVLGLVANLAHASHATASGDDYRVWGPVRNVGGRGVTLRFEIREETRADGGPRFVFCLHAAHDAEYTGGPVSCGDLQAAGLRRVLFGHHDPGEGTSGLRAGSGRLTVHGDALRAMGDQSIAPGRLDVDFDFDAGRAYKQLHVERLIPATFTTAARTVTYDYGKDGDAVDFFFQFDADVVGGGMTQALETVTLEASWREGGPGRGDGTVTGGDLQAGDTVTATECWDAEHLRTYYLMTPMMVTPEGDMGACPPKQ